MDAQSFDASWKGVEYDQQYWFWVISIWYHASRCIWFNHNFYSNSTPCTTVLSAYFVAANQKYDSFCRYIKNTIHSAVNIFYDCKLKGFSAHCIVRRQAFSYSSSSTFFELIHFCLNTTRIETKLSEASLELSARCIYPGHFYPIQKTFQGT